MVSISTETIDEYEQNGAVCLRAVFDKQWIESSIRGISKNLADPSPFSESLKEGSSPGSFFNDYCNWKKIKEFEDYVYNSPAAMVAGTLMQSELCQSSVFTCMFHSGIAMEHIPEKSVKSWGWLLMRPHNYAAFYHEHVLVKEPGSFKRTPWHHDQPYYPIDGSKVCSIWMPVDYVPEETCVQFVAGSHKWDWYYPTKFATCSSYPVKDDQYRDREYHPVPNITENSSKYTILKWELKPGDCIVFHMRTLHGAPGNVSSERPRRVLSTRWLGDDAVIASRPWETSPPVSGGLNSGDRAVSDEFPIIWKNPVFAN